ncbi:MAG: hypothetical protein ACI4GC_01465 [Acutalibacteraceae bacterium]
MKIEILFPELCNLYGDSSNMRYLSACAPEAEITYTANYSEPLFAKERVDLIYLGSMTENNQLLAIKKLKKYTGRIKELIEDGVIFLVTGNAIELFGEYIAKGEEKNEALGIFPFYAKRKVEYFRHNSMFLGQFENMEIVGCKSQFSYLYGSFNHPFIKVTGGYGNNPGDESDKNEGIRYKNFFATYLLGPLLVLNPLFTKYILRLLDCNDSLAFEKEAMDAYNFRLEGLKQEGVNFFMDEHG